MSDRNSNIMAEEARKKFAANQKAKAEAAKAEKAAAKEAAKQAERERREQERAAKAAAKEAEKAAAKEAARLEREKKAEERRLEKEREEEERRKSAYGKPSANTLEEALHDDGTYSARDIGRMCRIGSWNQISNHLSRAAARFDFEVSIERVLGPSLLPRQDQRLDLKGVAALVAVATHVPKDLQEAVADVDLAEAETESFFDEDYPYSTRELCPLVGIAWHQTEIRLNRIGQEFPDQVKETEWVSPSGRVLPDVRLTTKAAALFMLNLERKTPKVTLDFMLDLLSSGQAETYLDYISA